MSAVDIARMVMEALDAQDWATVYAHLTDDFVFAGPVPQPIGAQQWVGLQQALQTAMPDWSFNASKFEDKGGVVRVTVQISGTHTEDLDLSAMGLPVIPATSIHVQLPAEHPELTVKGDKVSAVNVQPTPGGGVPGLLAQLGVQMPH